MDNSFAQWRYGEHQGLHAQSQAWDFKPDHTKDYKTITSHGLPRILGPQRCVGLLEVQPAKGAQKPVHCFAASLNAADRDVISRSFKCFLQAYYPWSSGDTKIYTSRSAGYQGTWVLQANSKRTSSLGRQQQNCR
ncbi:hypothetical protein TNCV_1390991 [Trichonephila clavipes]|nr:hypothetical protein TNCV_1390991 [Trichonephila clavipes]